MEILNIVKDFLKKNLDPNKPVLFGFSGGSDSSCLLHILLEIKKEINFDLHIAHVDHGWRKESSFEASSIKEQMDKLNIRCHFKKLNLKTSKNLENISRIERLNFFKKLFDEFDFQSLILAHHKNDLAETIIKRLFEGSSIFSLYSMQEISKYEGLSIWRPLLKISKKEIEAYLEKNRVNHFNDPTNYDRKYLRAKMRLDILPHLEKNFNKQIINNLEFISHSSLELYNYLDKKTNIYFAKLLPSPFGFYIDLREVNEILEIKFIIKKILNDKKNEISRDILNQISNFILMKRANLCIKLKNSHLYVDRGYFFIVINHLNLFDTKIDSNNIYQKNNKNKLLIPNKKLIFGPYELDIKKVNYSKIKDLIENRKLSFSWEHLFKGDITIYLPEDEYFIGFSSNNKKFKKLWENNKIPSFLRKISPIIYNNDNAYDFLSGKLANLNKPNILQINLILK